MAKSTCKRRVSIANLGGAVAPGTEVAIPRGCAEFFIQAVDAAGAGVAFTLATQDNPGKVLHFAAGQAFTDDDLALEAGIVLLIASAAGSTVEVEIWEG